MGSYGSRSLAVGGAAIAKAVDKVIDKAKIIAAHLMEAADADVVFADGKFTVAGTDSEKGFGDIALAAYVRTTTRMTGSSRDWRRRRSTIRSTSHTRPERILPRSRSIRQPALSSLSTGPAVTISGT